MLQFLFAEPDQRFERGLVAEPMIAAQLEDLGIDETLDEAEHVGVGAALHLTEIAMVVGREERECARQRKPVREKFVGEIEPPAADDVGLDVPANPLGGSDAAGKPLCRGSVHDLHSSCGMASNGHRPKHRPREFAPACERAWKVAEPTWFPDSRPDGLTPQIAGAARQ